MPIVDRITHESQKYLTTEDKLSTPLWYRKIATISLVHGGYSKSDVGRCICLFVYMRRHEVQRGLLVVYGHLYYYYIFKMPRSSHFLSSMPSLFWFPLLFWWTRVVPLIHRRFASALPPFSCTHIRRLRKRWRRFSIVFAALDTHKSRISFVANAKLPR